METLSLLHVADAHRSHEFHRVISTQRGDSRFEPAVTEERLFDIATQLPLLLSFSTAVLLLLLLLTVESGRHRVAGVLSVPSVSLLLDELEWSCGTPIGVQHSL